MPYLQEADLKQQLKTGTLQNLYVLYGSEGYLKQFYANTILKAAVEESMEGFNLKKFDADDGIELSSVFEAAETLPVFGAYTGVLVHDYPLDALREEEKKQLDAFLKDVPKTAVLVFWQDSAEILPKKNAKWKNVLDKISKAGGAVVDLGPRSQSDSIRLLQSGAKKRGCNLGRAEAQYLMELVGNELSLLLNELEKLCNYKESGEITRQDIETLATKSLEANIFDLSKLLMAGNCQRALQILETLLADKEKPELILGTLISAYVDLYRVKLALEAGKTATYPAEFFPYKGREFRLRNAARDVRNRSVRALRQSLDDLQAADTALKSGVEDPKIVLEKLIVRLSAAKGML